MVPHHLGIRYCDDGSKWNQDTTKPSQRRASITSIRRSANPKVCMHSYYVTFASLYYISCNAKSKKNDA